jgi:uncharacterized protein YjiS (DUF1127 family)
MNMSSHTPALSAADTKYGLDDTGSAFLRAARHPLKWVIEEFRLARDINELSSLDSRMLQDIGLTRAEICDAVRHGQSRV